MAQNETAVAEWQPREVIRLGDYDRNRYNVLIPGAFTSQVTPFLVPVAREYTVDPNPDHGEVYVQEWRKNGNQFIPKSYGLSALCLANLSNLSGILEVPQASGRVDDGRDPTVCTYRSTMFMRLPDGQPIIRTREMTLELGTLLEEVRDRITKKGRENTYNNKPEPWKPERIEAEIRKESALIKKFFHRKCETGAKSRTQRAMMGIRSKYSPEEIARPFVLAAVVPDVNQPEVRARALDQAMSATAQLFGGGDIGAAPRQLNAGPSVDEIGERATGLAPGDESSKPTAEELAALAEGNAPLPGDDDDAGADAFDEAQGTVAAAAVVQSPTDSDEPEEALPSWGTDTVAAEPDLFTKIRDTAAAGGMKGAAQRPQIETLSKIFAVIGGRPVNLGLRIIWPDVDVKALALTGAQAQALINAARSVGKNADSYEEFAAEWRAAVEAAA